MKILLISPKAKSDESMKNGKGFRIAQMSLAQVAALMPPGIEVEIVDELLDPIPFDTDADLVGISIMTEVAERSYEIAGEYRRRGIPTVAGGIHATVCPREVGRHCDAVVIGEAEGQMSGLIDDFRRNRLKPYYRRNSPACLEGLPAPRRDIMNRAKYRTVNCVQMSRGCPHQCSFCIVPVVHGRTYRLRPMNEVLAEIEQLDGFELFFLDDNIAGNPRYAKEFFTRLAPLKKKWIGQLSFNSLKNDELLRIFRKSGGVGFFIGLESVSQDSLASVGKRQKVQDFIDGVKRLHDHGMGMVGAFVFGMDTDGPDVFKRTVDFVDRCGIDIIQFTMLTPFPGTPLYKSLRRQGRLINPEWWLDSSWNLVPFQPARMTREELRHGWIWAQNEVYKVSRVVKRVVAQIPKRPWYISAFDVWMNLSYRFGLQAVSGGNGVRAAALKGDSDNGQISSSPWERT